MFQQLLLASSLTIQSPTMSHCASPSPITALAFWSTSHADSNHPAYTPHGVHCTIHRYDNCQFQTQRTDGLQPYPCINLVRSGVSEHCPWATGLHHVFKDHDQGQCRDSAQRDSCTWWWRAHGSVDERFVPWVPQWQHSLGIHNLRWKTISTLATFRYQGRSLPPIDGNGGVWLGGAWYRDAPGHLCCCTWLLHVKLSVDYHIRVKHVQLTTCLMTAAPLHVSQKAVKHQVYDPRLFIGKLQKPL